MQDILIRNFSNKMNVIQKEVLRTIRKTKKVIFCATPTSTRLVSGDHEVRNLVMKFSSFKSFY